MLNHKNNYIYWSIYNLITYKVSLEFCSKQSKLFMCFQYVWCQSLNTVTPVQLHSNTHIIALRFSSALMSSRPSVISWSLSIPYHQHFMWKHVSLSATPDSIKDSAVQAASFQFVFVTARCNTQNQISCFTKDSQYLPIDLLVKLTILFPKSVFL